MDLAAALTELAYSKDWTPATRRWYQQKLQAFATFANQVGVDTVEGITAPLVRRYLDHCRSTPSTATRQPIDSQTLHGHARAIRAFLNWAVAEGLLDERVPKRLTMPKREQKVLHILTDDHIARLMREATHTSTPARDTALLSLLLDTGCRASELCGLTLADVTFTPDEAWILVHGKGRKQRTVAVGKKARQALHRYIHRERRAPASQEHVFLGGKGPLTPEGLDRLLYRLRDAAGRQHFEGVSVAAHRWRHTHAVKALEAGVDIFTLSRQMGHAEIGVTTGYLKAVSDRALRRLSISVLDTYRQAR